MKLFLLEILLLNQMVVKAVVGNMNDSKGCLKGHLIHFKDLWKYKPFYFSLKLFVYQ